jgi:hypothetical protein
MYSTHTNSILKGFRKIGRIAGFSLWASAWIIGFVLVAATVSYTAERQCERALGWYISR